jgi:hypothetical protein
MRRVFIYGLILVALSSFMDGSNDDIYINIDQNCFSPGERIEYKLSFSIFTVGRARTIIQDKIYKVNNRPSYKIDVYGETSGLVDWLAHVDDHWGAYLDSASLLPHQTYRNIIEGRYRSNEIVRYDHSTKMIEVKALNQETKEFEEPKYYYSSEKNMYDILSGMLFLRSVDFTKKNIGDTVKVDAFLEDTFYHFQTVLIGRELISTKVGKFRSLVLVPVMPDNEIFDGEHSIQVWVTDDKNKIPLKAKGKMFIGSAGAEITSFAALRNPISRYV